MVKKSDKEVSDVNDHVPDKDLAGKDNETSYETDSYEELLEKKDNLETALLRANADLDNALKRTFAEVEKAHKYGVEKLLNELLPVIDNLEHALEKLSDSASSDDKEGIELTLKSFEKALDKFGMRPIYPEGENFDPEKHEAISMEQDAKKADGSIGNIFKEDGSFILGF